MQINASPPEWDLQKCASFAVLLGILVPRQARVGLGLGMEETKHGAMIAHLGRLARHDRSRLLGSAPNVDSEISKADREALQELESGLSMPDPLVRSRVEQSLRWREGSLTEALNKTTDEVTPDWLRDWAQDEPALLASGLSDEALLSEVINRLGRWRARS